MSRRLALGRVLIGVDEAGRGPLARPVTVAAAALDYGRVIGGLNDSKKLSARAREKIFASLRASGAYICVASSSAAMVDSRGILGALFAACRSAVRRLEKRLAGRGHRAGLVIFDGNIPIRGLRLPQIALVGGDGKSAAVAAASVAAKTSRDAVMRKLDKRYPGYGFARHKGYGTAAHIAALGRLGPCEIHRASFVKNFVKAR